MIQSYKVFISKNNSTNFIEKYGYSEKNNKILSSKTGDNISDKFDRYKNLTSHYWIWKNYNKLDNPSFVGFINENKYFNFNLEEKENKVSIYLNKEENTSFEDLENLIVKYNVIVPKISELGTKSSVYNYFKSLFDFNLIIDLLISKYPYLKKSTEIYQSGMNAYLDNIFIMDKDNFFCYSEILFDILSSIENSIHFKDCDFIEVSKLIFGIYITYLKIEKYESIAEISTNKILYPDVSFIEKNEDINICFALDNNFIIHTSVAIASLLKNAKTKQKINIYLLYNDTNISKKDQNKVLQLNRLRLNSNIEFIKISNIQWKDLQLNKLHFNHTIYYRFIVSSIFKNLNKILYLDSDIVVLGDISDLYSVNIKDKYLACVTGLNYNLCSNRLNLGINRYFNSGVLLMNLELFRRDNIVEHLFLFSKFSKVLYGDQDALNIICGGNVQYIDFSWNHAILPDGDFKELTNLLNNIEKNNPNIIHYISPSKPWYKYNFSKRSQYYYKYLKYTPWKYKYIFWKKKSPDYINIKKEKFLLIKFIPIFEISINRQWDVYITIYKIFKIINIKVIKYKNKTTIYIYNIPILKINKKR